jgi:hypothetical protein
MSDQTDQVFSEAAGVATSPHDARFDGGLSNDRPSTVIPFPLQVTAPVKLEETGFKERDLEIENVLLENCAVRLALDILNLRQRLMEPRKKRRSVNLA